MGMNLKNSVFVAILPLVTSLISLSNASAQNWKGTTSNWSTATNWNPTGVPSSSGTATFKATGSSSVTFSADASVGLIRFNAGAQAYTFSVSGHTLALGGGGINDNSSNTQTFNVSSGALTFSNNADAADVIINNNSGGQTAFYNTASAHNAVITNNPNGSTTFNDSSTAGNSTINTAGTTVYFGGSSTAGHATLNNTFNGNIGGAQFNSTATAGNATINNTGGYAAFLGTSNAGSATITNDLDGSSNQGVTDFYNSSDASTATIFNKNGSVTYFTNTATADAAKIINTNGGYVYFQNTSTGSTSIIKNDGGGTYFFDTANANSAKITNTNSGVLNFNDSSDAGTATINNKDSYTSFNTTSTADQAQITNKAKGVTYFNNSSTAGTATITNEKKGTTYFNDTSSGASALILNNAGGTVDISGATKSIKIGAIDGAGDINLGGKRLIIGGLASDVSPVISGVIADGGNSGGKKGKLTLNSTGSLTLSGSNTYTGRTTLTAGTLIAANSSAFGTSRVRVNGGILETDNINHVINVGNNYIQNGGTLVLNLNDVPESANNDVVNVTGTAKLNGTLSIVYNAGTIGPKDVVTYTVITTTGGVTSAGSGFTAPTFQAGALAITVTGSIVGNDFDVILSGIQTPFTALAGTNFTPNQLSVASYFDRFDVTIHSGPVIPLIKALDAVSANPSELGRAFDQLTPLKFGSFASTTAFNNAAFFNQQMDSYFASHRGADGSFVSSNGGIDYSGLVMNDPNTDSSLQSVRSHLLAWSPAPNTGLISDSGDLLTGGVDMKNIDCRCGPTNAWNVFVSGNVILAQDFSNSNAGLPFANSTTGAVQVGADYKLSSHWLVGAMFGYGHTDATLDTIGSNASVDTYSPAVYAGYSENGWYANGIASYGFASYDQNRSVQIGAFGGTANSTPGGDQIVANLDGGYDFHRKNWTFGPTAGLGYTHLDVNGYTETGLPGANLTVSGQQADSLRSRLGWGVSYAFRDASLTFTPHLNASWQHEFFDQSRGITSQFDTVGAGSFVVNTAGTSRDSALIDLGVDVQINDALTAFVDYAAQAGQSNYFGQSVQGGFKIGF